MTMIESPPCVGSLDDPPRHDLFMDLWCILVGRNNSTTLHMVANYRYEPRARTPRGASRSHRYGAMYERKVPLLYALRAGYPLCPECSVTTHLRTNHPDSSAFLESPW